MKHNKKLLLLAILTTSLVACNNGKSSTNTSGATAALGAPIAISNTIIGIQGSQLQGATSVRVDFFSAGLVKPTSVTQNCVADKYCEFILAGFISKPGYHKIQFYNVATTKLIGEVVVDKFAAHKGDDIFTVGFSDLPAKVSNNTSVSAPTALAGSFVPVPREWVVRANGFFKAVAGYHPAFKAKMEMAEGFFNILTGGGSSGGSPTPIDLQPILDKLNQISDQVVDVKNDITDLTVLHVKKLVEDKLVNHDAKVAALVQVSGTINLPLQKYRNNIDLYISAVGVNNSVFKSDGFDNQLNDALKGVADVTSERNIVNATEAFQAILNEKSTDSRRVNLIQRNMYYNAAYSEYFLDSVIILRQAAELEKILAFLVSKDGSKYASQFNFATARVSNSYSYVQNIERINAYYKPLIEKFMPYIDPKRLEAPYGAINISEDSKRNAAWYDASSKSINLFMFLEATGFQFDYFDGYTLKGTWGGEKSKTGWFTASTFVIPYSEWDGRLMSYEQTRPITGSYTTVSKLAYYIPKKYQSGLGGKKGFNLFDSRWNGEMAHASGWRGWEDKYAEQWGYSQAYRKIRIEGDIYDSKLLSSSIAPDQYEDGKYNHSGYNMFDYDRATKSIVLTRPIKAEWIKHSDKYYLATAVYSITARSPIDNKYRIYTFGVNVNAWRHSWVTDDGDHGIFNDKFWHSDMAWDGAAFCVTPNCSSRDASVSRDLEFSDGTLLKMYNPHGDNSDPVIELSKYPHTYKVKAEFIDHNQDVYSEVKIYNINSGSHELTNNEVKSFGDNFKVDKFRYKYKIVSHDGSKSDYPEFDLKLENNYCHSYNTKVVNSRKTCVYEHGGVYIIKTSAELDNK